MTGMRQHFVESHSSRGGGIDCRGDARVSESVTPDMQADALPDLADDAQDRTRFKPAVAILAAVAVRQKQEACLITAMLQVSPNRIDRGLRQKAARARYAARRAFV
jgi:hypothetical protein